MGDGPEPIADKQELLRVRRGARTANLTILTTALAATGLFVALG